MESFKKIGYLLIALVYLLLSTGVALVKTNCVCADLTDISVYDISDTHSESLSDHNCCEESLPVNGNNHANEHSACGCDIPTVTYFKLTNHPGSETKLEYPFGKTLCIAYFPETIIFSVENVPAEVVEYPNYSPPEKPYGRILISFLNQRKIALTA